MKTKSLLVVPMLLSLFLTSCGTGADTSSSDDSGNASVDSPRADGQNGGQRMGRGGPRSGSGARFGSGGMMNKLPAEDQAVFKQMMDARKSGNTELVKQLESQLQQKYPNMRFGKRDGGPSGSGATQSGAVQS